jgi:hypothetical protein
MGNDYGSGFNQEQTAALSQTQPGVLTGGLTNPNGTQVQAITTNNPAPDQGVKIGSLDSSGSDAYIAGLAQQRDALLQNKGASETGVNAQTGQKDVVINPIQQANPSHYFDIGKAAQSAAQPQYDKINDQYNEQNAKLAAAKKEADATASAMEFKMGVSGTEYGAQALAKVNQDFAWQQQDLDRQKSAAMDAAWNAALSGQIGASQKMASDAVAADTAKQDLLNKQLTAQKDVQTIKDMQIKDFAGFSDGLLASGKSITDMSPAAISAIFPNLTRPEQLAYFNTAKQEYDAKQATTEEDKQTKSIAAAKSLSEFMGTQVLGVPVKVGNHEYIALSKSNPSGVEVSGKTGDALYYEYDTKTGKASSTPMGSVGYEKDTGWATQDFGTKGFWRVNANTGEMLPMAPGPGQKTNNAVFPEKTKGPALPGHEANAGQCGAACNYWYGKPLLPDSYDGKKAALAPNGIDVNDVQTGDTFLMRVGTTGHVGLVGDVHTDPNGKKVVTVTESNMVPPGQGLLSNSRTMSVDDPRITLWARVPTPNMPPSGPDSAVTQAANGNSNLTPEGAFITGVKKDVTGTTGTGDKVLSPTELKDYKDLYPDAGILPTDTLAQAQAKGAKEEKNPSSSTEATTTLAGVKVPSRIAGDVEDVLSGRNTLQSIKQNQGRSAKAAAQMKELRDSIRSIDPNFDFISSDAGGKFVSSEYFQKSKAAINSVMPNVDKIIDLSNQVPRIGIAGVDSLLQKGAVQIGNKKVANFREAQKLIGDEIGLALGGGGMSDMKLQLGFDVTDPSMSPEVFASNMGLVKEFIQNRSKGLDQQRYASSVSTTDPMKDPANADKVAAARKANYSDDEIRAYLNKK